MHDLPFLDEARVRIEPVYRAVVDGFPAHLRHVGGYHIGWWDAEARPCEKTGKSIRPALTLASAAAMGAGRDHDAMAAAVDAAVAVELVHDFSLLHDDIMDGDAMRRHRPAAWVQFGVGQAILVGDVFLTSAMDLLAARDARSTRALTRALRALCEGQAADLAFENDASADMESSLRMAENKTGALLGAACELGALAAGVDPQRALIMYEFGLKLGLSYQLVDDILGVWGDPESTGKPVHSDLMRRKKSLPITAALCSRTAAGRELSRLYTTTTDFDSDQLARAAALADQAGGRRWARRRSREAGTAARRLLEKADPAPEAAATLLMLSDLITERNQ
jgi:geranylgeranyl diphosphate synthase type I